MSERRPYLTASGVLVIPFDAPMECQYWRHKEDSRKALAKILRELNAPPEVMRRYLGEEK